MAMVRVFVAIDCSEKLRAACGRAVEDLEEVVDGVRWVRLQDLHLTLKFLGEVEDRELNTVCQRVSQTVASSSKFTAFCQSLGAFPNIQRPNTIWIGVDDPDRQLEKLQKQLEEELSELGFPAERRPFQPHVTLGRTKSRRFQKPDWEATVARYENHDFGPLDVREVVVYSSELERGGPLYTPLARIPLQG